MKNVMKPICNTCQNFGIPSEKNCPSCGAVSYLFENFIAWEEERKFSKSLEKEPLPKFKYVGTFGPDEQFISMTAFKAHLYIASTKSVYEICDGKLKKLEINNESTNGIRVK